MEPEVCDKCQAPIGGDIHFELCEVPAMQSTIQELRNALWYLLESVEETSDPLTLSLRPLNRKAAIENARRLLGRPLTSAGR